ncbi:MAG: hypothetical protein JXA30_09275 [Deltaproteobacteria bacterium]|nr:hypothetical protein [Deltaproteobacteria bacterium]
MVLAVPDETARGRKPVFRDESAAVVAKQQYPPVQLHEFDLMRGLESRAVRRLLY